MKVPSGRLVAGGGRISCGIALAAAWFVLAAAFPAVFAAAYLEIERDDVEFEIPDPGLVFNTGQSSRFFSKTERYLFGVTDDAGDGPRLFAVRIRDRLPAWFTSEGEMIFASETRTADARIPVGKGERFRVLSESESEYRIELKRGSRAVAISVPKKARGLKKLELQEAAAPVPPPVVPIPVGPAVSPLPVAPSPPPPVAVTPPPVPPVPGPGGVSPGVVISTQIVVVSAGETGQPLQPATVLTATGTASAASSSFWNRYRFWPESFKWPANSNECIQFLIDYRVYVASGFGGLLLILLLLYKPGHARRRPMPPVHSIPTPHPIAAPTRARDLVQPPRPEPPPPAPAAPAVPQGAAAPAGAPASPGAPAAPPPRPRLESRRIGSALPDEMGDAAPPPVPAARAASPPLVREEKRTPRRARATAADVPPSMAAAVAEGPVVLKLSKPVAPFGAERSPDSTILMNLGNLAGATGKDTVHLRKDSPEPPASGGSPQFVLKNKGKIGKYEVEEILGQGSMGVVYRARQPELDRVVALKMLISGMHASAKQREKFLLEARAMAQLRHPNIVTVYDVDEYEGQPFFAMEFIEGTPLEKLIHTHTWSNAEVAELTAKISDAIQYAHSRGIIHRDLKPANVIVTKGGEPLITDFGLARNLQAERSSIHGEIVGTPCYMAPEQARGRPEEIDARTDIYAVGAILYALMTRREPFPGGSLLETLAAVLQHNPTAIREVNPLADERLVEICEKAMRKDPAQRYQNAQEMLEALVQYVYIAPR